MPTTSGSRLLALVALLSATTGSTAAVGVQDLKSKVAGAANIPLNETRPPVLAPSPCPQIAAPVIQKGHYLIVNRTNSRLSCRMRHPTIGGWSSFATVSAGKRMLDGKLDLDEIVVQCRPPVRIVPVRVFPSRRYALLRTDGSSEVRLVEVVAGQ